MDSANKPDTALRACAEALTDYESVRAAVRDDFGQLRTAFDAVVADNAALRTGPAHEYYRDLIDRMAREIGLLLEERKSLRAEAPATDKVIDRIIQVIAELPDRTSPEDWPDAMLVTADELRAILGTELRAEALAPSTDTGPTTALSLLCRLRSALMDLNIDGVNVWENWMDDDGVLHREVDAVLNGVAVPSAEKRS